MIRTLTKEDNQFVKDTIKESIEVFGTEAQLDQLLEEMSELAMAVLKFKRATKFGASDIKMQLLIDNIKEERVDVEVMLQDLDMIFGMKKQHYSDILFKKITRLKKYICEKTKAI